MTFECTVFGGGDVTTVWKGDFFNCSAKRRVIELAHSQRDDFSSHICNNGNVVGKFIRIDNDSFISQLNVTLTRNITGKRIECIRDNVTNMEIIGSINLTSG